MAAEAQSYQSHRRFLPGYHFFILPVLIINIVVELVRLIRSPSSSQAWMMIVAIALLGLALVARLMALTAQTRVIRLEEQLRLARLMPAEEHTTIAALRTRHLIGLRFASDAEAPGLARRCAAGDLQSSGDVKREVKSWRPDHLRV